MKKTAALLALAALPMASMAQSSVTLYGRVNTSVESQQVGDASRATVVQNNSSRWGMRGTEDIGGGLKASFNLESGFNSANGVSNAALFGRAANVQLAGGFGAVRMGTWFNGSYFAIADYISNHNHDTGTSSDALFASGIFGRNTSKIAYFTPTINGVNAEVSMALGQRTRADAYDVAVNYVGGPLHLGLGYGKQNRFGTTDLPYEHLGVRAFYTFGGGLAAGAYVQREDNNGVTRNIYRLSGMMTRGASEYHLNVGSTSARSGAANTGALQYTLAYNHNLSKRTKLYAFYTVVDNESAATYSTGVRGADFNSVSLGIRHNF